MLVVSLHRTLLSAGRHQCLNLAQSAAYSAIVALFPTLIVAAAIIGLLPDQAPLRFQLSAFFDGILPPDVSPILDTYFQSSDATTHSLRALLGAALVSFVGASNVMVTLMEGLRRARGLPPGTWSFWRRRFRAFALVPLSLVPLAVASLLVVFGHAVNGWLVESLGPAVRGSIYFVTLLVRWVVALGSSVALIAAIYHFGMPKVPRPGAGSLRSAGARTLPGAVVATAMWFLTTLAFGWYVTRFANYSEVYGSLGAGIALLVWLYLISLSVLCGAEFNAQLEAQRTPRTPSSATPE
jgi:membrane protein